jgi:carboxyl-terminal processing protease
MKKTRIAFIVLLMLTSGLLLCAVLHPVPKSEKRRAILQIMVSGIESEHFDPVPVNDSLSDRIYKLYLKRLNSDKLYFTQEDMNKFKPYEYILDTAINQGTFEFYDLVNKVWSKRLGQDSVYVKELLSKPFDFTVQEDFQSDGNKVSYPKNDKELYDRWRKLVKYEALVNLADMLNDEDKAKEKKDTSYKAKPFAKLEDSARVMVLKTEETYFKNFAELNDTDKMTEFFDVVANCFDPHTEYFAPEERKNFDIDMSGQLEGIGAQLAVKSGKITIDKVIPGSPAWKSGELKEGDVFLKVAQGKGEPVDIEGMRLDKAVQLIRGKKGTEVRLTVKSGTSTKVVSLIRDVIQLQEKYAHAGIIENNGQKMGYIRLPEFYTDFDGSGAHRCSDDVRALVKELKGENVKGIIIDLRDNGGGSLQDVVKMVGIFVPQGPIVQIKSPSRKPQILSSTDSAALYKGPLLVLVNGYSASASEIFAAAIQDYKRGVIMGSQTYGKGTVQQIFTLDDKLPPSFNNLKPLGSVKITISKFYRINGGTTQRDGVMPDVLIPDPYQYIYEKEKNADYPLAWDKIAPANYKVWGDAPDVSSLADQSLTRTGKDSVFNLMREDATRFKNEHDSSLFSLNLDIYRKAEKQRTEYNKRFNLISRALPFESVPPFNMPATLDHSADSTHKEGQNNGGGFYGVAGKYKVVISPTTGEKDKMRADTNEAKMEEIWLKRITKDPELFEATRVIGDMK